MKKSRKIGIILLAILLLLQFESLQVEASSAAAFYVQTAAPLEDNTIEVCVYLDEVDNLGGVDLELVYDANKVTFVSSSLGASLQSSLSDIYHDVEKESIHYVLIYSESKAAHGILFKATFQLKETASYQPQLIVNDVVDSTEEIKDISYTIQYQQADGTWSGTQDTSGEVAEETIIEDTLNEYGAPEDLEDSDSQDTISIDSENNISGVTTDTEELVEEGDTENMEATEMPEERVESTENIEATEISGVTMDTEESVMEGNTKNVETAEMQKEQVESTEDIETTEVLEQGDEIEKKEADSSTKLFSVIGVISLLIVISIVVFIRKRRER